MGSPQLFRRVLGSLTAISAVLVLWSMSTASPASAPTAVVFVGLTFAWHITRPAPVPAGAVLRCTGCTAGCARCRERL